MILRYLIRITVIVFLVCCSSFANATILNDNLLTQCITGVPLKTMLALVQTESNFNPYAIGVVDHPLNKQPTSLEEALNVVNQLDKEGKNYSMGLGQINVHNLKAFGLNKQTVFDVCSNLRASSQILKSCFIQSKTSGQEGLQKALSCYYSGNFTRGFKVEKGLNSSYVQRVYQSAQNLRTKVLGVDLAKLESNEDLSIKNVPRISVNENSDTSKLDTPTNLVIINSDNVRTGTHSWDVFGDFK